MQKSPQFEPNQSRSPRYQERLRVRAAALTAVSVSLTEASDVVAACSAARSLASRLCFEVSEIDRLAAAVAAGGGALVGVGGRGSALVSDASDPEHIVLRVTLDLRVVSFGLIEAAILRVAAPWRHRPALGLPAGAFHWDVESSRGTGRGQITFALTRQRVVSGARSPFNTTQ